VYSIFFHYFSLLVLHLISGANPYNKMATSILEECHETFVSCFHAFYPTAFLKWTCLCDLLAVMDKVGSVVSKLINSFIWAK
jgi:E3 ubiquitin-protein ligase MYCBP2